MTATGMGKHHWGFCGGCGLMILCGTCGMNSCGGKGEDCPDCDHEIDRAPTIEQALEMKRYASQLIHELNGKVSTVDSLRDAAATAGMADAFDQILAQRAKTRAADELQSRADIQDFLDDFAADYVETEDEREKEIEAMAKIWHVSFETVMHKRAAGDYLNTHTRWEDLTEFKQDVLCEVMRGCNFTRR